MVTPSVTTHQRWTTFRSQGVDGNAMQCRNPNSIAQPSPSISSIEVPTDPRSLIPTKIIHAGRFSDRVRRQCEDSVAAPARHRIATRDFLHMSMNSTSVHSGGTINRGRWPSSSKTTENSALCRLWRAGESRRKNRRAFGAARLRERCLRKSRASTERMRMCAWA